MAGEVVTGVSHLIPGLRSRMCKCGSVRRASTVCLEVLVTKERSSDLNRGSAALTGPCAVLSSSGRGCDQANGRYGLLKALDNCRSEASPNFDLVPLPERRAHHHCGRFIKRREQSRAVHPRECEIEKHDVDFTPAQSLQSVDAVYGPDDDVALGSKNRHSRVSNVLLVINHQHPRPTETLLHELDCWLLDTFGTVWMEWTRILGVTVIGDTCTAPSDAGDSGSTHRSDASSAWPSP